MKIIDAAMRRIGFVRAATYNLVKWFGSAQTRAGATISNDSALSIAAVYACITVISEDVAKLPLKVYRKRGSVREERPDHPVATLLRRPNPLIRPFEWRQAITAHVLGWGNGYTLLRRNGRGEVVQLDPLGPARVTPQMKDGKLIYEVRDDNGYRDNYTPDRIMHLRGLSYDGLVGYNVIQVARESLGLAKAMEDFAANFFGSGANQRGVLEYPNVLGKEAIERLRDGWLRQSTDPDTRKPLILENGMKWSATSVKPEEAQFLESRTFTIPEICRWFRMKPHKIADLSRATFSNIEEENEQYVTETLMPWLIRWEQMIESDLFTGDELSDGYYVKHNVDALLRGNTAARHAAYSAGRQWGYYSVNDIREKEDMNPVEGGDIYLQPSNMQPLGSAFNPSSSLLYADTAGRIAASEAREISKHLAHAKENPELFSQWSCEFWAKQRQYVERTVSPLAVACGKSGREVIDEIIATGESRMSDADFWPSSRAEQIHKILRDRL